MSWNEIQKRAIEFSKEWENESSEKAESQTFWNEFFNIFGLSRKTRASFEAPVRKLGDKKGFIDLFWKETVLVEHKSRGEDLESAYEQGLDYFPGISEEELPKYIFVSDFANFKLHNLELGEQFEFSIEELYKNIHLFDFIGGFKKHVIADGPPVNIKAAILMGRLHDALKDS